MPRYRLLIEYDGTGFSGWQSQAEGTGVQDYLQRAIFRFAGEAVIIKGAGRTDAGVHALGQVCHFDIGKTLRPDTIRDAGNVHLRPHAITIVSAEEVPESFDARFSAVRRHYRYRVFARRAPPTLERHLVWHVPVPLDVARMADAATVLLGRHDFTTFLKLSTHAGKLSKMPRIIFGASFGLRAANSTSVVASAKAKECVPDATRETASPEPGEPSSFMLKPRSLLMPLSCP